MANLIEAVSVTNPYGVLDTCSHIKTDAKSNLMITECMPYITTYAFRFWIRSTTPQTISFTCDSTYKEFNTTKEWACFSIVFPVSRISSLMLELPKGQYWIYNMKLEIGEYFTDWSPHPEDGIVAYEEKFAELEQVLVSHQSTIQTTKSLVDAVNQEITNRVSKTTFESEITGLLENVDSKFTNVEDGYDKWHISIYNKSQFKDTKLDDDVDDRERCDMGIFLLDNSDINPIDEALINDNPIDMRIDSSGKILYYIAFAKFSEDTVINLQCSYKNASLYLNGIVKFIAGDTGFAKAGTTAMTLNFTEGWNLIEIVSNEGNMTFSQNISEHENCILFNCLLGIPTQRTVRIREQGAYLNIYLDKIVSEVFDNYMEDVYDDQGNFIRKRKALRSKIQQNADMIELMVENVDTDEGTNVTTLTLTDKLIQAVTNQFIVKGADGTSTIISGGVLSTDALKSNNYEESLEEDPDAPKFSEAGTFVDLAEGSIYTPSLYFDGTTNEAYFRGTVYATNGTFNGTITSNDAVLGPWHLTSTSLYKGSRNFAQAGNSNIYMGDAGLSLSDLLVYNSLDGTLSLKVDSISITGKTVYDTVMEGGNRMYYTSGVPTSRNYPANQWSGDQAFIEHIGDMCYDVNTGKIYVFKRTNTDRYQINFDSQTETRAADYVEIYYKYNRIIHKVLEKVHGNGSTSETVVIPSDNFYVYWHTDSTGSGLGEYWGFAIDSVTVLDEDAELSPNLYPENLPMYALDSSLDPGEFPESEHPYELVDLDKLWYVQLDIEQYGLYGWVEIENQELTQTTSLANQTSDSLDQFLNEDLAGIIQAQDDKMIQTWYQDADPATENTVDNPTWTAATKPNHIGDIWYNSSTGISRSYIYIYDATEQEYRWDLMTTEPPQDVFDQIDGKATVFTEQPTPPYRAKDLWVNATFAYNGVTYTNEIVKCVQTRLSGDFNPADWTLASKYTDDSALTTFVNGAYASTLEQVRNQIDRKIDTWYQENNPATEDTQDNPAWTSTTMPNHVGDIWYKPSDQKYRIYTEVVDEDTGEITYVWDITDVEPPQAVLDVIDGKAQIFVAQPDNQAYYVGDLWVNATYPATGEKTYDNDILKCVRDSSGTTFNISDWALASKYTDDSALSTFVNGVYASTLQDVQNQLDQKIQTWYQENRPDTENTLDNPAWTAETKPLHVGDIWYKISEQKYRIYTETTDEVTGETAYVWDLTDINPPQEIMDTIDGKAQVFVSQPNNQEYYVGDLWVNAIYPATGTRIYDNEILRCIQDSNGTTFSISDWALASKYTDDTGLTQFINTTYQNDLESINQSLDGKIQTWYQPIDPGTSESWSTSDLKELHVGDIWFNSTASVMKYYMYKATTSNGVTTYAWEEMKTEPPSAIMDTIDGKANIFVGSTTPVHPKTGDLWFQGRDQAILTFTGTTWEEYNKYTDDSALTNFLTNTYTVDMSLVQSQLDGKIQTWYQMGDPQTTESWDSNDKKQLHIGDIWFNSTSSVMKYYIYVYKNSTYSWEEMKTEPPQAVMDTIDGKANVFVGSTTPTNPSTGDLWFKGANEPILTYTGSSWEEYNKYTDDSSLNTFIDGTYSSDMATIQSQIDGRIQTWYQSTDPVTSESWNTNEKKALHVGDIWFNSTSSVMKYYIYKATTSGSTTTYSWEEMKTQPPQAIMDEIDGKASIFVGASTPSGPSIGDLWFKGSDQPIYTYTSSGWQIYNSYTDDSALTTFLSGTYSTDISGIQSQLDGKMQTWYQATDPVTSESWNTNDKKALHVGDIWFNSTSSVMKYYIYVYKNNAYSWEEMKTEPPSAIMDTIDGKASVFVGTNTPSNPSKGDLWFKGDTEPILTYTGSAWQVYNKYTDDSSLNTFLSDTYASDIQSINETLDGKIETWYQTGDPVSTESWNTNDKKALHIGDIWFNSTSSVEKYYMYVYKNNTYQWEEMKTEPPQSVMDTIDGKAQIFVAQPNNQAYYVGDLWVNATYPSTGTKTYDNDILKCVTDSTGTTFSISDWALASRYTDSASFDAFLNNEFSTLSNQVDQKAEIWQGSSDPSTAWTTEALKASHVDDMWYDASVGKYKIYSATTSGNTTTYGWTLTDITPPSSVLSTIDGKANVYVGATLPAGITPKTGDLWFKGTNEAIYTYNGSSWVVYNKYTDDSSLTAFLDGYSGTLTQVQSQIDQKAEIWKSSSDPSSAWTTTALKNNHLGDIWFDTTNQVCKTYVLDGSTYKWEVMTTQPPTSVLNTIDGKANIFVGSTAPTVPYKVGDLWVNATYTSGSTSYTNEILKCKTARSTGTFTLSDWEKASKYTDDTTAIESAKTASSYIYYDSTNGLVLHGLNDTITSNNFATKMSTIGANARLTSSGLGIYVNNKLLTQYGESTYFYSWNGNTQSVAATLSSTGLNIAKGTITLGSNFSVAADGTLTAAAGTIANINITTTTNTNTHYFKDSLYSQATEIIGNETVRIYEFGINASDDADDTSTPVFYVRQNNPLSSWTSSNGQWNFYVSKSGDLYARNASFGDDSFIITSTANTSTHCYAHSLYKHSFEINETTGNTSGAYECGISGDDSYYFLYVNKKNNVSGTWASSNISNLFYVNYSGDLVCQNFASNYISSNSSGTYLGNISAQSGGHTNTTKVLCLSDTATSGKYKVGYVTIEPGETAVEEEEMSSIRFKNVDRNLTSDDIEAFYSVNPVFASYKDEYLNGRDYWKDVKMPMMIAEDIEKALPKSVKYDSDDNVKDYSNHVVLSVHQKMLIDQREKITKLEEEVAQLKKLLAKLG